MQHSMLRIKAPQVWAQGTGCFLGRRGTRDTLVSGYRYLCLKILASTPVVTRYHQGHQEPFIPWVTLPHSTLSSVDFPPPGKDQGQGQGRVWSWLAGIDYLVLETVQRKPILTEPRSREGCNPNPRRLGMS